MSNFTILKSFPDKQIVGGIVSVSTMADGSPYFDIEGDTIEPQDLINIAEDFMLNDCTFDLEHNSIIEGAPPITAKVVQSFVITPEICTSLGLTSSIYGYAWWLAVHIEHEGIWEKIKSGEFKGFSIGGIAERISMED